jgi:outer membrane protein TolC
LPDYLGAIMARAPLLQLSDISLTFGGNPVFDGLSLVVQPGDRVALVGRNGSGKSTLMKVTAVDPGKIEMVKADGLDTGLYELQLLEQKKLLTQKQTKLAKDGYLPSLSLTGNLMYSAFTDRIDHWIHSGESNHWYGSNGLGIQLRVPVFDGFEKRSKIRKAKIEEENARIGYEDALKGLQANYMNAVSEVNNSQRNYKKQFDNYTMAQDVYNVTADQYKEGVASMTAVLQDEMRMSEAMNNYLTAYYRYKVANLSLLKLTGQLNQISVAK